MITDVFDGVSEEIIKVKRTGKAGRADACIVTFSHTIIDYALNRFECAQVGFLGGSNGQIPVYMFDCEGKRFALYMTPVGAPACVGEMEGAIGLIDTDKFVVFGGAGCLNKEIAHGRVMVPTAARRDEGTSYHYAPASDYIAVKNSETVAAFMEEAGLPYVKGKTWTTDAFYRETRANFEKRKADGCISVEMECAAVQAMCDMRGVNAYFFFTSGDLLDAPVWDQRAAKNQIEGTQHDPGHFDIALELALWLAR